MNGVQKLCTYVNIQDIFLYKKDESMTAKILSKLGNWIVYL